MFLRAYRVHSFDNEVLEGSDGLYAQLTLHQAVGDSLKNEDIKQYTDSKYTRLNPA